MQDGLVEQAQRGDAGSVRLPGPPGRRPVPGDRGADPPSAGPSRYHQGPGQIDELWILDADGLLVVMDAMYGAETPDEHVAELHAILESMTFEE